jgi:hypothetical protein
VTVSIDPRLLATSDEAARLWRIRPGRPKRPATIEATRIFRALADPARLHAPARA